MANTSFDPLRLDPFATSNEVSPTKSESLVPYGQTTTGSNEAQSSTSDVLLDFANSSNSNSSPIPQQEFDVRKTRRERIDSYTSTSSLRSKGSITSNKTSNLAPPPELPANRDYTSTLFHSTSEPDLASKPKYEKITHSGTCLGRISIRTKLLKVWKTVFWIIYDDRELFVFKSKNIFDEWLMNPHLSRVERDSLVKLRIDFVSRAQNCGYQASMIKKKHYRKKGLTHQFKVDMWDFQNGPSIVAAFGSENVQDVYELHTIVKQLLKESPLNIDNMGYENLHDHGLRGDDNMSNVSNSVHSGGDSVRTSPTFARPAAYYNAPSTYSTKSY